MAARINFISPASHIAISGYVTKLWPVGYNLCFGGEYNFQEVSFSGEYFCLSFFLLAGMQTWQMELEQPSWIMIRHWPLYGSCVLSNAELLGERTLDASDRGAFTNSGLPMFTFTRNKYLPYLTHCHFGHSVTCSWTYIITDTGDNWCTRLDWESELSIGWQQWLYESTSELMFIPRFWAWMTNIRNKEVGGRDGFRGKIKRSHEHCPDDTKCRLSETLEWGGTQPSPEDSPSYFCESPWAFHFILRNMSSHVLSL